MNTKYANPPEQEDVAGSRRRLEQAIMQERECTNTKWIGFKALPWIYLVYHGKKPEPYPCLVCTLKLAFAGRKKQT